MCDWKKGTKKDRDILREAGDANGVCIGNSVSRRKLAKPTSLANGQIYLVPGCASAFLTITAAANECNTVFLYEC